MFFYTNVSSKCDNLSDFDIFCIGGCSNFHRSSFTGRTIKLDKFSHSYSVEVLLVMMMTLKFSEESEANLLCVYVFVYEFLSLSCEVLTV